MLDKENRLTFPSDLPNNLEGIFSIIDSAEDTYADDPDPFDDLSGSFVIDRDGGDDCEVFEGVFAFCAGPHQNGTDGFLSDALSCYDFMEKLLKPLAKENGFEIDIGAAENYHQVTLPEEHAKDPTQADKAFELIKLALVDAMPGGCQLLDLSEIANYHLA